MLRLERRKIAFLGVVENEPVSAVAVEIPLAFSLLPEAAIVVIVWLLIIIIIVIEVPLAFAVSAAAIIVPAVVVMDMLLMILVVVVVIHAAAAVAVAVIALKGNGGEAFVFEASKVVPFVACGHLPHSAASPCGEGPAGSSRRAPIIIECECFVVVRIVVFHTLQRQLIRRIRAR